LVPNAGFCFTETFPADGHLLLFAENERQRFDWEEFLVRDAPYEFPALRFDLFDRTGLQRVFATQRRVGSNPQSTDLSAASFDTYWIKWYLELFQRSTIARVMASFRDRFASATDAVTRSRLFSHLLGRVDREFSAWSKSDFGDDLDAVAERICEIELDGRLRLDPSEVKTILIDLQRRIKDSAGIFSPISETNLRLFGECKSALLPELNSLSYIRRSSAKDPHASELLSIPYYANVSFLVCRDDLLRGVKSDEWRSVDALAEKLYRETEEAARTFLETHRSALCGLSPTMADNKFSFPERKPFPNRPGQDADIGEPAVPIRPRCWEEMLAVCELKGWEMLIETRTFDTFLCCFLEIAWACGTRLKIDQEYSVYFPVETASRLFLAAHLLHLAVQRGVIPQYSTVEAQTFGRLYSHDEAGSGSRKQWAFARHWHSTFVDILTAQNSGDYAWKPGVVDLAIIPIPTSAWGGVPGAVSCWGDWHLTVLQGSENDALAVELINNLMSSHKISDRALRGAALPTVEAFYEKYGNRPCMRLSRPGITMPRMTYAQLRAEVFSVAKARSEVFDYRHCMRELHGLLEFIISTPEASAEELGKILVATLQSIQRLRDRELLLH
jgi:hypothetical protein